MMYSPIFMVPIAALLPVVLLFLYIYHQDSEQPEPASKLWKGVLYGVLSALVTVLLLEAFQINLFIEAFVPSGIPMAIAKAFLLAAIPEEAIKLLFIILLIRNNPFFDEHLDGIVYATCVGLGFAGFENLLYIIANTDNLLSIALIRGIFSVPGHFFFAVVMGYFISVSYFSSTTETEKKHNLILAFVVPMILHGIFDMLLMIMAVNESLIIICFVLFLFLTHILRKEGCKRIHMLKMKDQKESVKEE
ncbi:MAG: PrsW family intramembrane metalloprotease [Prevotella sp.]